MLGHSDSSVQEQVKFSWETTPAVLRSNTLLRPSLTEYLSSEAPHILLSAPFHVACPALGPVFVWASMTCPTCRK